MNRKLIKQGGGGYTIYLPKKWVSNRGLKRGDQINILERGTSLVIDSSFRERKESNLEISEENKRDIQNLLTHLYRSGVDVINLSGVDEKAFSQIRKITTDLLLGFEVTHREKDKCTISNISEPSGEKYETLLRRIFLIIKETQRVVIQGFEKGSFSQMQEIEDLRGQQDKFVLFCRRIVMREKYERNPVINWELLTFLMHIEHAYYYLYKYAKDNKVRGNERILYLLNKQEEYFDLYYNAFYRQDLKYVHSLNKLKAELQFGKCYEYLEKAGGKEAVIFSHLREIFRLIQVGSSPIIIDIMEKKLA